MFETDFWDKKWDNAVLIVSVTVYIGDNLSLNLTHDYFEGETLQFAEILNLPSYLGNGSSIVMSNFNLGNFPCYGQYLYWGTCEKSNHVAK